MRSFRLVLTYLVLLLNLYLVFVLLCLRCAVIAHTQLFFDHIAFLWDAHPHSIFQTALDWLPCPWGSNLQAKSTTNSEVSTQLSKATNKSQITAASTGLSAKTLPSLELGDEASTAGKPPDELRRVRPGLQRRNSVHPYEDELDASEPTVQQSVSVEKGEDNGNDLGQLSTMERRILAQNTLDNTPAFVASAGQHSYGK